jgi:hypothetical protein
VFVRSLRMSMASPLGHAFLCHSSLLQVKGPRENQGWISASNQRPREKHHGRF